jgi:hypothetical protein
MHSKNGWTELSLLHFPASTNFSFGNNKKSHGATSGEYGRWETHTLLAKQRKVRSSTIVVEISNCCAAFLSTFSLQIFSHKPQNNCREIMIHNLSLLDELLMHNHIHQTTIPNCSAPIAEVIPLLNFKKPLKC